MGHFPLNRVFDLASLRARYAAPREVVGPQPVRRARSLCVVSGKGGTGKSVVSASLARIFSRGGRTLLVDADLGVGNAHILQGVTPRWTLADLFVGRAPSQLVQSCGERLDLLAGGSGVARLASISYSDLARIGDALGELEPHYDYLIADCGAGISEATLAFARAADRVVVVTTPDLTAMTDAYAFLKVLGIPSTGPAPALVVNRAPDETVARDTAGRVEAVGRRFLGRGPDVLGWLPEDPSVTPSVNQRTPLVERSPRGPAALALEGLAQELLERLDGQHPRGLGRHLASLPSAARA